MLTATIIRQLDEERRRQGLTKAELARRCRLPATTLRRLFSSKISDVKMSTVEKITKVLGAEVELRKIDAGLPADLGRELMERVNRRHLAERLAGRTGHDAGDIEHALYNLTLSPIEQMRRRFRGRQVHQRR